MFLQPSQYILNAPLFHRFVCLASRSLALLRMNLLPFEVIGEVVGSCQNRWLGPCDSVGVYRWQQILCAALCTHLGPRRAGESCSNSNCSEGRCSGRNCYESLACAITGERWPPSSNRHAVCDKHEFQIYSVLSIVTLNFSESPALFLTAPSPSMQILTKPVDTRPVPNFPTF